MLGSAVAEPTYFSMSQVRSSSLHIRNVMPEHAGQYTYKAISEHGSMVSKALLRVGKLEAQNCTVNSLI